MNNNLCNLYPESAGICIRGISIQTKGEYIIVTRYCEVLSSRALNFVNFTTLLNNTGTVHSLD